MNPAQSQANPRIRPPERTEILGVSFDAVTKKEAAQRILHMRDTSRSGWIATVNVAILMTMQTEPDLKRYVDESSLVLADGQPIVWGSRLLPPRLPERVTGVDLIIYLFEECEKQGRSVYILGGTEEVNSKVLARASREFPQLRIAGSNGYFDNEEGAHRANLISDFRADILIVGMGAPRQERFIQEHWDAFGVGAAIGVGGSLNILAGTLQRAPQWMQSSGLEWTYRLQQEPRRLFRRYAVTNTRFCIAFARELVRREKDEGSQRTGALSPARRPLPRIDHEG